MATVKAKGQEVRARPPQNDEVVIATVSGVSYADILNQDPLVVAEDVPRAGEPICPER